MTTEHAQHDQFARSPERIEMDNLAIQIMFKLRDTRTSLWRAASILNLKRSTLKDLIGGEYNDLSPEQMRSLATMTAALPYRRFGLVTHRLESWRTPTHVLRARDEKARNAIIRYYRKHPNEEGAADIVRFLESQQRSVSEAKTSGP